MPKDDKIKKSLETTIKTDANGNENSVQNINNNNTFLQRSQNELQFNSIHSIIANEF